MESSRWNLGEMVSGMLFVGGTVGLAVLPLLDRREHLSRFPAAGYRLRGRGRSGAAAAALTAAS